VGKRSEVDRIVLLGDPRHVVGPPLVANAEKNERGHRGTDQGGPLALRVQVSAGEVHQRPQARHHEVEDHLVGQRPRRSDDPEEVLLREDVGEGQVLQEAHPLLAAPGVA
jgi:hypothetical protein